MTDIIVPEQLDPDVELDRLALRYNSAGHGAVKFLNALGGQAESLIDQLPQPVRAGLRDATEQALNVSVSAAERSRRAVPDQASWVNTAVTTAMGAAGGAGGVSTALVELPLTTTLLFRTIQGTAAKYGFDPRAASTKYDSLRVFAAAGPLQSDDGADTAFLTVRLSVTGQMLGGLAKVLAPRFSVVLGQKLAAQSVPVLGAMAGATTNFVYARYYEQIAHVQFGLRRLALHSDVPGPQLVSRLREKMQ